MHLRLIYGVGEHPANELLGDVRNFLARNQIEVKSMDVLAWSKGVERPTSRLLFNMRSTHLCHLLVAMRQCAFQPILPSSVMQRTWLLLDAWLFVSPAIVLLILAGALRPELPALLSSQASEIMFRAGWLIAYYWSVSLIAISLAASAHVVWDAVRLKATGWFWPLVRRYLLLLLRPVMHIAVFFSVPWPVLMFFVPLGFYLFCGRMTEFQEFPSASPSDFWPAISLIVGYVVVRVIGVMLQTASWALMAPLRVVFKVCADICMYVGNPVYRSKIRTDVVSALSSLNQPDTDVVLFAHSLGSLIAVDALLQMKEIHARIYLFTAGSPLKRFFWRFFPFCSTDVNSVAKELVQRSNGQVRWINVYRRHDPIGERISTERSTDIEEAMISSSRGYLTAHLDYWTDEEVLGVAKTALSGA